jgi:hypothetical protein
MRVPQSYIQKCKVVGHVFQALFIFVAGCITLAIMTKDGSTGGATKFFFALASLMKYHEGITANNYVCSVLSLDPP